MDSDFEPRGGGGGGRGGGAGCLRLFFPKYRKIRAGFPLLDLPLVSSSNVTQRLA